MPQEVDKAEPLPTVKLTVHGTLEITEGGVRLFLTPAPGASWAPIGEDRLEMLVHLTRKLSGCFAKERLPSGLFPDFVNSDRPGFYVSPHLLDEHSSRCVYHFKDQARGSQEDTSAVLAGAEARTLGAYRPQVSREVATFERRASMLLGREVLVDFAGVGGVDASETGGYSTV